MKFFYALLLSLSMTIAHAQTKSTTITQNVKQAIEKQIPEAKQWSMQIKPMGNQFFQVKVTQGEYHPKPTMFMVMQGKTEQDFLILGTVIFHTTKENRCYFPSTIDKTCSIINTDGSLSSVSSYQNNLLHGMQTLYHDQKIMNQVTYENGLKHGLLITYLYSPSEIIEIRSTYQHDKKIEPSIRMQNGMVGMQGRSDDNLPDLLTVTYYNNGMPTTIIGMASSTPSISKSSIITPLTRYYRFYINGQLANSTIFNTSNNKDIDIPPLEENNWYPNGQMAIQIRHDKMGKLLAENYWDEHGNTLATKPDMQPFMDQSHELDIEEKQP